MPPDTNISQFHVRFTNVTAQEARGDKVKVAARRLATQTPWRQLDLTPEQVLLIQGLYSMAGSKSTNELSECTFSEGSEEQQEAMALLRNLKLDLVSLEDVFSRWSNKWSQTSGQGAGRRERVLYQW